MLRDMIDKEFHRDQIEGFCPPLVKLPQISKQASPVSTPNLKQNKIKGKETAAHFCDVEQPRCQESNLLPNLTGFIYPWGKGVIQFELDLRDLELFLQFCQE